MVEHVQMASTATRVLVYWGTVMSIVAQVSNTAHCCGVSSICNLELIPYFDRYLSFFLVCLVV